LLKRKIYEGEISFIVIFVIYARADPEGVEIKYPSYLDDLYLAKGYSI
jgi:hypothetical protein